MPAAPRPGGRRPQRGPRPTGRSARRPWLGHARQGRRHDLDPCGRGGEARLHRQEGRPCRHPRSARLRHPADRARRGDQDRPLRHGRPQGLPCSPSPGASRPTPTTPRARSVATSDARPEPRGDRGRCCRASSARSSRCRRATRRSRSRASAPTTSPATARSVELQRPHRSRSTGSRSSQHDGDRTVIEAECGKGTYVRAIARDLGRALGCLGHVAALRRTRVGPFTEADPARRRLDRSRHRGRARHLRPVETALDAIPRSRSRRDMAACA